MWSNFFIKCKLVPRMNLTDDYCWLMIRSLLLLNQNDRNPIWLHWREHEAITKLSVSIQLGKYEDVWQFSLINTENNPSCSSVSSASSNLKHVTGEGNIQDSSFPDLKHVYIHIPEESSSEWKSLGSKELYEVTYRIYVSG